MGSIISQHVAVKRINQDDKTAVGVLLLLETPSQCPTLCLMVFMLVGSLFSNEAKERGKLRDLKSTGV